MSFEVRCRDMLARIGRIRTKSGLIETPTLLPVVNPGIQLVPPRTLREEFKCSAIITNAYILKRRFGADAITKGIHQLLDFDGPIMTDSGAYQILIYGEVDVNPAEIVTYQEQISADIATILDIPTGWDVSKKAAERTVNETIKRAKQLPSMASREDVLWVAPIQGGRYLDLVTCSAEELGKLPFPIHALGSPTEVMKQYRFDVLANMIVTAKINTPPQRPLHLFGAGHPFMFALAVALGCDTFDSAAYAIFARKNRYMTEYGTKRLPELEYLPCSCPICSTIDVTELKKLPIEERQKAIAKHNLYVSFAELKRIKQSIKEGRLWEHLEERSHSHPTLLQAVNQLKKYEAYIERHAPITKPSGLLFFSGLGLVRPEIVRYRKLLTHRFKPPEKAEILILLPRPSKKPFHNSREVTWLIERLSEEFSSKKNRFHICIYTAPFGVVPLELDEIYPLSQHEIPQSLDSKTLNYVLQQIKNYIRAYDYRQVIMIKDAIFWSHIPLEQQLMIEGLSVKILHAEEGLEEGVLNDLIRILRDQEV
jgi:7-cyano-7-deazaguanine tRNA-ribosyltransferase